VSPIAAALLGVVQGLTEFLPISSSAHLIIARDVFGLQMSPELDLAFDVACHVGTLLAVVAFFWSDLLGMLRGALSWRPASAGRRAGPPEGSPHVQRIWLIAVGTLPIVVVGVLGGTVLEDTLRKPEVAVVTLVLGAVWLLAAERVAVTPKGVADPSIKDALLIGIAQATALVPGMSRSGMTIGTGMFLGYRRADVARFTFLLSIPAILAAAAKNALELRDATLSSSELQAFVIGLVTSGIVGYLTIRFFLRYLASHRLDAFAWYRIILSGVLLVFLLTR
jgi:undecaprenyl-diphosphatase